ncbi:MAG: hypothetical protein ACRDFX_12030, partial [Chloroflexota bacterium]
TKSTGIRSPLQYIGWAPLLFNVLYLPPLFVLLRSRHIPIRASWMAVWLFYVSNWVSQDYFSPQAFNFLLYLLLLAVLLTYFGRDPQSARFGNCRPRFLTGALGARLVDDRRLDWPAAVRVAALLVIVALYVVMASGHQLTPLLTLASVLILTAIGRCSARTLPLLMSVILGASLSYLSITFLAGHMWMIWNGFGGFLGNLHTDVGSRVQGSVGHVFVLHVRILMSLAIWALAALGAVRLLRRRSLDLSRSVLALTPFLFLPLNAYGGEMLLRVYLFALPFIVFLAAGLVYPPGNEGRGVRTAVVSSCMVLALTAGLLVSRYGNERMNYFAARDLRAVNWTYRHAPPQSLLVSANGNLPWRGRHYQNFTYFSLTDLDHWSSLLQVPRKMRVALAGEMRKNTFRGSQRAYLIMTPSQEAEFRMFGNSGGQTIHSIETALHKQRLARLVFSDGNAKVYRLQL